MVIPSAGTILSELSLPKTRWKRPVLIGIFGVPCAGKTYVAHYLADHHPFLVLTTDMLRLKYGFASGPDAFAMMVDMAEHLLPQKVSLIFDGIHLQVQNRAEVRILAERHAVHYRLIFVEATPEVISQRLQERLKHPEESIASGKFVITQEHFDRLASYLEPPTEAETDVVVVDTTEGTIKEQLRGVDAWLANGYV